MADSEDMDVEDWRDAKFKVPDPPRKPDFLQGVDNMHWTQFSRKLAATLKDDKSGFDVKLYDPSDPTPDPTGRNPSPIPLPYARSPDPSITPWYRLGPPSAIPDYPVLIEKYGLQVLEAAGFLNHESNFISKRINGRLASESWRIDQGDTDIETKIHPVLRREMWNRVTDSQYLLIQPALLLATAILDDPVTLCYFHALAEPVTSMDTVSHVSAGLTADCKIMRIPNSLTEDQQRDIYMKLHSMTEYLQDWGFDNEGMDNIAYTSSLAYLSGVPKAAARP